MPAVAGREAHPKEVAEFAIEVGHLGLGAGQNADGQIAQAVQVFGQEPQGGTFTRTRIADDQGETAFADLLFDPPAKALDWWRRPEGADGRLRGEGIKLQAVEIEQSFVHERFWGVGGGGR